MALQSLHINPWRETEYLELGPEAEAWKGRMYAVGWIGRQATQAALIGQQG
jgi:hypothetical protein